ncbi:hypothetical protein BBG03_03330 [Streptococcus dysgalactiae subsp. equisimilis]|uniref:hypothetical protein n=1 Tax=Streptococcus dysgalactiae TaxID=1334 RepID=UPI000807AEBF|nr:hypothetical protein [Streptococcus dysgalactiae]OBZ00627.1 hypothetical protein BBG03_03330 [Streptococcus dysgalactiae subsp. equisimilis]
MEENNRLSKIQVVEASLLIARRRRLMKTFKEECEMYLDRTEVDTILPHIPEKYQKCYDEIIQEAKEKMDQLSLEMLDDVFSS